MIASPPSLSSEEQEQLLQTIEMFEVIVQASPQDCQSLEILKDAYARLGKLPEALGTARKLAHSYSELGQYSQAMLEYESILKKDPNDAEVMAAMGEVEERLHKKARPAPPLPTSNGNGSGSGINLDFRTVIVDDGGTLITTEQTVRALGERASQASESGAVTFSDDGNELLARFLIQHRLVAEEIVSSAAERIAKKNGDRGAQVVSASLIDEICRRGAIELDALLCGILDRSKFAYIPLEYYDVDRSVVKMLPEEITLGRLIVPFDVMSRTLMVAMANPFDATGKETVQRLLDYNIQWHLASPQAIARVLGEAYRLGSGALSLSR